MRKYIFFLKCSSVVVKIAAWIFLCLAILSGGSLFFGMVPRNPRWVDWIILGIYTFLFFFLFLVAKIADLLVKIISGGGGSACGGSVALPTASARGEPLGRNEIKGG